jgi:hypothetical protein
VRKCGPIRRICRRNRFIAALFPTISNSLFSTGAPKSLGRGKAGEEADVEIDMAALFIGKTSRQVSHEDAKKAGDPQHSDRSPALQLVC